MKPVLGVAVVVALSFWAGFRAFHSSSLALAIQTGLAIAIGCNLVFGVWLWFRAERGSGDAMVLPTVIPAARVGLDAGIDHPPRAVAGSRGDPPDRNYWLRRHLDRDGDQRDSPTPAPAPARRPVLTAPAIRAHD